MSVHNGHRERMRERLEKGDFLNFAPHEVLELILYYTIPRHDTNEIGHALIDRFKTLNGVFHAPVKELEKVKGIGPNSAAFLKLLGQVCRYTDHETETLNEFLCEDTDYKRYLHNLFRGQRNEMLYLLCLDAKCMVLDCVMVAEGSVNHVNLPTRKIVDTAISLNATSVILAHNHPSGFAIPSHDDVQATINLGRVLRAVDVNLVDHMVFAMDDCISMAKSNYYSLDKL